MTDPKSVCEVCKCDSSTRPGSLNPGCCGAWYHLECFKTIASCGGKHCPSCQTPFPAAFLNISTTESSPSPYVPQVPIAEPVLVQAQVVGNSAPPPPPRVIPRIPTTRQRFLRPNADDLDDYIGAISTTEDAIEAWVPPERGLEESTAVISVECVPELPQISLDRTEPFRSVVSLFSTDRSADKKTESARPPMDLVCVLDTSGSMRSDNKLVNLKHAVEYIRSELNENDRLSIITFENTARRIHSLKRMTDEMKVASAQITSRIEPGGGTRILSGLEAAHAVLESRQAQNPITSVFLLTDGIDSSDMRQKKETARKLKQMGSSLFVFGFGNDHDSAHLRTIATAADGTFTYVEASDMVIDAFGGALGAEQSIFANNLCLTIKATTPGSVITQVESGLYRKEIARDGSFANVYFKNLMLGEERDVLVTMALPATSDESDAAPVLSTEVTYVPLGVEVNSPDRLLARGDDCVVARVAAARLDPSVTRNERVDVEINRLLLTRATEEAMRAADSADYARAKRTIEEAIQEVSSSASMAAGNVKSAAFGAELQATLDNVRDANEYSRGGGRAYMSEQAQNYSAQRCCYQKSSRVENVFQSASSGMQQSKAKNSKSARR